MTMGGAFIMASGMATGYMYNWMVGFVVVCIGLALPLYSIYLENRDETILNTKRIKNTLDVVEDQVGHNNIKIYGKYCFGTTILYKVKSEPENGYYYRVSVDRKTADVNYIEIIEGKVVVVNEGFHQG